MTLTGVFEPAEEGGFIANVEELPGANTQDETLEEARAELLDAVTLLLETNREAGEREIDGRSVIREPLNLGVCSASTWFATSKPMAADSCARAASTPFTATRAVSHGAARSRDQGGARAPYLPGGRRTAAVERSARQSSSPPSPRVLARST